MFWVLKRAVSLRWFFWVPTTYQGFFQQFWEKAPGQNCEKMIDFTSKLGEINDIEYNKGSKIYPQDQVSLIVLCQTYHLSHFLISSSGL